MPGRHCRTAGRIRIALEPVGDFYALQGIASADDVLVELAEADGNRTRQDCVAALLIGFEVRAGHQRRERFRGGY